MNELKNKILSINKHYAFALFLTLYSFTKLFWDHYFSSVFEILFLAVIVVGAVLRLCRSRITKGELYLYVIWLILEIYCVLNGFIAGNIPRLIRGLYEYNFYLLFFPACVYYAEVICANSDKFLKTISKLSFGLSVLGIIEYMLGKTLLTGKFSGTTINGVKTFRTKVFARSFLTFGMEMAILSVISFYLFLVTKKKRYLILLGLNIVALLTTSSRGPLVAAAIACLVVYLWEDGKVSFKRKIMQLAIVVGVGIVIFLIVAKVSNNDTVQYYVDRISAIFDWSGDAGNRGRLSRWKKTLLLWKESPLFGIGVSSTGSWDLDHVIITTESGVLKRLVELGVVGFGLLYSCIVGAIVYSLRKIAFCANKMKSFAKLSLACVLCILIEDAVLQVTEEVVVMFFLWMFVGMAMRAVQVGDSHEDKMICEEGANVSDRQI